MKYPDLHRKFMFGNFLWGKGWEQLTNTFFWELDSNPPQLFVVMLEIKKWEFWAVPYIS